MRDATQSVLIAAVGGQGAVLAARVLGRYAEGLGLDVKLSEVHGMSQRGGSVVTHVRFGREVFSPVIERGGADAIIAFEMLEAARLVGNLRPGGTIIVNRQRIPPLPVLVGTAAYPADLEAALLSLEACTVLIDGQRLAEHAGSTRAVNTVLLGAYARHHGHDRRSWHAALEEVVKRQHLPANLAAFDAGYDPAPPPAPIEIRGGSACP